MKRLLFAVAAVTALGIATFSAQGQAPARQGGPATRLWFLTEGVFGRDLLKAHYDGAH